MADIFTRHLKMTQSGGRGGEAGKRPISFSPADQSNKHAGFISQLGYELCEGVCVCVHILCKHTISPVEIIHPEHLSAWITTPESSCNRAHPTNWWHPANHPSPFTFIWSLLFQIFSSLFPFVLSLLHLPHLYACLLSASSLYPILT